MHLRFPAAHRRSLTLAPAFGPACRSLLCLAVCLAAASCRQPADAAPEIALDWSVAPSPPAAGPATVSLMLTDKSSTRPVRGASLRIEGTMTHPGMQPVFAEAQELAPGRYAAPIELSMAGDWVLLIDARLRDGRTLRRQVMLPGVRPKPGG